MSDLIERQATIDEIEERKNANGYRNVAVISELNRLEGYIMRLPSAQPDLTADQIHTMKEQEYMRGYEDGRKVERESWDEMLVMCDNCGHAIHVKREDVRKQKPSEVGAQMSLPDGDDELSKAIHHYEELAEYYTFGSGYKEKEWENLRLAKWLQELKERRKRDNT